MVIKLRKILNDKYEKCASMTKNVKQLEVKKKENEDAINKAIKMVVINTLIGLLFKFSFCIISTVFFTFMRTFLINLQIP